MLMRTLLLILLIFPFIFSSCEKEEPLSYLDSKQISDIGTKEEDNIILAELYDEIMNLSNKEPCADLSECDYIPIGCKPCGGPTGYIAYSTNINVGEFLAKVMNYNEQQSAYNIKWRLVSDCSTPPVPTNIMCEDGKAVLVYQEQ